MALSIGTFELESSLDPPTLSILNSFSFVMVIPPMSIIPSSPSINSLSPSLKEFPSSEISCQFANTVANPPHSYPYHVPQYSMMSSWVI
jgi:hypothetical protein